MKDKAFLFICVLFGLGMFTACSPENKTEEDYLKSWNDGPVKEALIDFLEVKVKNIPVSDRIATLDMDGTIICEAPLWLEMYCAVEGLNIQQKKNPILLEKPMYQYARKLKQNPKDTSVINNYRNYVTKMINTAFLNEDNESYIEFCRKYLAQTNNVDYGRPLIETFYQPMTELIAYLKAKEFQVYIVSGSRQGLVWAVVEKELGFERDHLIGTRQTMMPIYSKSKGFEMALLDNYLEPKVGSAGKPISIYNQIGKTPVFAFGNTIDDFDMLRMASSNPHPNMALLLNHDDKNREYVYPPWHGHVSKVLETSWKDTIAHNNWHLVNMSENFKTVFGD